MGFLILALCLALVLNYNAVGLFFNKRLLTPILSISPSQIPSISIKHTFEELYPEITSHHKISLD